VHASIGLATIAQEWLGLGAGPARALAAAFALAIAVLGLRAVYGLVAA
jgi:fumarate reductase subunit C